jgi:methionyl-tRNA formyltransferase
MKKLRIVFMGTPEFAVPSLQRLADAGYPIAGVVTAPDKPAGRGLQMTESAVKKFALARGFKILQPEKLKSPDFIAELKSLDADLQVVVAFRMLPEVVWKLPPLGTINLHGSLLPQYRGAAPINWAIINGELETGVTSFRLQQEIDTGNILLQKKIAIGEEETAGELHDTMMQVGADVLLQTVDKLSAHQLQEVPQPSLVSGSNDSLHHAPKIFTETCAIDWQRDIDQIYNLIRGLSPYPGAFTFFQNKKLKIFGAIKEPSRVKEKPSTFVTDHKKYLKFTGNDGYISITSLQLEGKKKMGVEEFLRGWRNV